MKKAGVYKISFIGSTRFYIGSSNNLMLRKSQHKHDLKYKKHCNPFLQRMFNKYGEFEFTILEECNELQLIDREQYYIDTLRPHLNNCKIAGRVTGIKYKRKNRIYPIVFNNKIMQEKDCDDLFVAFYHQREYGFPVYVAEGMSIYPDGTWESY